jgi:hypothetical protein
MAKMEWTREERLDKRKAGRMDADLEGIQIV